MEERESSSGTPDHLAPLQPQHFRSGTYVVQVPKDQIYRIPPPENADIIERHRNPVQQKGICGSSCCCYSCSLVATIIFILMVLFLGIYFIFLNPKNPNFYIEHVLVNSHANNSYPQYDIKLKAQNPNGAATIFYKHGGVTSLSYKRKQIAAGRYPKFDQEQKNSTILGLILKGSNVVLPKEIARSMKSRESKVQISLSLMVNVPVEMKALSLKTGSKEIAIACDMKVDTLAKGTQLLSQNCNTIG